MEKMPHSLEAEQAVVGMALISKYALQEATSYLEPVDFFDNKNATIFIALKELLERGDVVDVTTIVSHLMAKKQLEAVGGIEYLTDVTTSIASTANIASYVKIVSERSTARKLIHASTRVKSMVEESSDEMADILAQAENEFLAVTRKLSGGSFRKADSIVENVLHEVKRVEDLGGILPGTQTGYEKLDSMTAGFQAGDYVILAARPSMGKTAFALNLLSGAARHNDGAVAMFSLEMPSEQIIRRLMSAEGQVDQSVIRTPHLMSDSDRRKLYFAADKVSKMNIFIDDTPALKLSELQSRARKLASENKISLLVIDYLSLITLGKSYNNKVIEVGEISKGLKTLARELEIPIIVLSQLSRGVESRVDKRPIMSDLRESGAIEQDADIVMFLYRDKYYNTESELGDLSELLIRKHRNGPTGTVELTFINKFGLFVG